MSLGKLWAAAIAAVLVIGIGGCEKQGPLERAGEEVDEAVDTVKNGEESTATKVDDAVDEAREVVEEDK
jgi:altronate dehydratase